ncbi:6256_t:CDS:2, partial [Dentiscutata heterogama]
DLVKKFKSIVSTSVIGTGGTLTLFGSLASLKTLFKEISDHKKDYDNLANNFLSSDDDKIEISSFAQAITNLICIQLMIPRMLEIEESMMLEVEESVMSKIKQSVQDSVTGFFEREKSWINSVQDSVTRSFAKPNESVDEILKKVEELTNFVTVSVNKSLNNFDKSKTESNNSLDMSKTESNNSLDKSKTESNNSLDKSKTESNKSGKQKMAKFVFKRIKKIEKKIEKKMNEEKFKKKIIEDLKRMNKNDIEKEMIHLFYDFYYDYYNVDLFYNDKVNISVILSFLFREMGKRWKKYKEIKDRKNERIKDGENEGTKGGRKSLKKVLIFVECLISQISTIIKFLEIFFFIIFHLNFYFLGIMSFQFNFKKISMTAKQMEGINRILFGLPLYERNMKNKDHAHVDIKNMGRTYIDIEPQPNYSDDRSISKMSVIGQSEYASDKTAAIVAGWALIYLWNASDDHLPIFWISDNCTPRRTSSVVPPALKLCPAISVPGARSLSVLMNQCFVAGSPLALMNNALLPLAYVGSVLRIICLWVFVLGSCIVAKELVPALSNLKLCIFGILATSC